MARCAGVLVVCLAMVGAPLTASATHPSMFGAITRDGVVVSDVHGPVLAKIGFSTCGGPTLVTVTLQTPSGPVDETVEADFTAVPDLNDCLNYTPAALLTLRGPEIDMTGTAQGFHIVVTADLAGTFKGQLATFAISAA